MTIAATSVPREARFLGGRLRAITPALPVYRDTGQRTKLVNNVSVPVGRQIVYRRQGGADIQTHHGTFAVRSVWLCYVSEPVSGAMVYVEELQADADRMHEALVNPAAATTVDGRFVQVDRRDLEHHLPVYDGTTLVEMQLGGTYIVVTNLT